jgi:hypothetical protein
MGDNKFKIKAMKLAMSMKRKENKLSHASLMSTKGAKYAITTLKTWD